MGVLNSKDSFTLKEIAKFTQENKFNSQTTQVSKIYDDITDLLNILCLENFNTIS
ncbi:hypothetical protein [uncultured Helicobacter sp.]|uniref:hypothetical protein n=1 Tax=uncultured Helicobacter sp. TaxID=175537 RepID=UPI002639CF39|nr:hypothetical protein [uncultured Helicobacter sp.]